MTKNVIKNFSNVFIGILLQREEHVIFWGKFIANSYASVYWFKWPSWMKDSLIKRWIWCCSRACPSWCSACFSSSNVWIGGVLWRALRTMMSHMCSLGFQSGLRADYGSVATDSTQNIPAQHDHDVVCHCHPITLALVKESDCQNKAQHLHQECPFGDFIH